MEFDAKTLVRKMITNDNILGIFSRIAGRTGKTGAGHWRARRTSAGRGPDVDKC